MIKKRFGSFLIVLILLFTNLGIVYAATPIGQDNTQGYPIKSGMETNEEVEAIHLQLSGISGSAVLSQDKKIGKYAAEVYTGTSPSSYAQFTLVDSGDYSAAEYGEVRLQVKPKQGAQWISFYTESNGTNELIKSDGNTDGIFEIGTDLTSGQWNTVTLRLVDAKITIGAVNSLIVRSNIGSTWGFDEITALKTTLYSLSLSMLENDHTVITGGGLRFEQNGINAYDTTEQILNSGLKVIEIKDDTRAEFMEGTFSGTEMIGRMMVGKSDSCSGGSAIGSGTNPQYAFDSSNGTEHVSAYMGNAINGLDYIGYNFATSKNIRSIRLFQNPDFNYVITSIKLQYFDQQWLTVKTLDLPKSTSTECFNTDSDVESTKWRILANSGLGSNQRWYVSDLSFLDDSEGVYFSKVHDLDNINVLKRITCSWTESESDEASCEMRISADGGTNWTPWTKTENGIPINELQGLNLSNGKVQYRVLLTTGTLVKDVTIHAEGDPVANVLPEGKISAVQINRTFYDFSGKVMERLDQPYVIKNSNATKWALSGDGTVIWYADSSTGNTLAVLDLSTKGTSAIAGSVSPSDNIFVNMDGTFGYTNNQIVNLKVSTPKSCYSIAAGMRTSGDLYIADNNSNLSQWATTEGLRKVTSANFNSNRNTGKFEMAEDESIFVTILKAYSGTPYELYLFKDISLNGAESKVIYSAPSNNYMICDAWLTANGNTIVFSVKNNLDMKIEYYRYEVDTEVLRKINIPTGASQIAVDNKVFAFGSYYDLNTDKVVEFGAPEAGTPVKFEMSDDGEIMVYSMGDSLKKYYVNGAIPPDRYLLSFDGKNSWYTCKDGIWDLVKSGQVPTVDEQKQYGMTLEEINALDKSDFAKLYTGGKQIYTIDLSIYYASVDPSITPSINSIDVLMDSGADPYQTGTSHDAIYAAKAKTYNSLDWRKIGKIYPVEITPKKAEIYYFAQVNGEYKTMKGSTWISAGTLPVNADANWIEITQKGVSAVELRQIDSTALTTNLLTNNPLGDFSIIYCMKVYDDSTAGYHSEIYVDYTADLFDSASLTLNITYNDGTTAVYSGLDDDAVENFMAWILGRQYGKGPIFYLIKTGTTHNFINYYMIQNASVVEL